jgi:hypothetical protein
MLKADMIKGLKLDTLKLDEKHVVNPDIPYEED